MEKPRENERVDDHAIVLDVNGKFPRKLILVDKGQLKAEYKIVRTKSGALCMNK